MVATFVEPSMNYAEYPMDFQNFSIVMQSYTYANYFVLLNFLGNQPVLLLSNPTSGYAISNQYANVKSNQLWTYLGYTASIADVSQPSAQNPLRKFSMFFLGLQFQRKSQGIIFRLAVPILIFLIII